MERATTADSSVRSPKTTSSARPSAPTGRRSESEPSEPTPRRRGRRPATRRLFRFDRGFGARFVAGADEAGRGSLAGPLVAAAVLFDYERLTPGRARTLSGLNDSKQKTAAEREGLAPKVLSAAASVALTVRCPRGIDGRGLHVTNLAALADTLRQVACEGAVLLTDGFRVPSLELDHEAVVDGDAKSAAIAAASVIAKTTRDRYMHRAAELYPGFGFESSVGYSTPEHREAIAAQGICDLHRRSFASVAYRQLEMGESA